MSFLDEFQDFRHPHKNVKKFKNYHVDDLDQNFTFNCTRTFFAHSKYTKNLRIGFRSNRDDAQKHAAHRIF